jgi:hypothetical protein
VTSKWPREDENPSIVPEFIILDPDVSENLAALTADLVIADASGIFDRRGRLSCKDKDSIHQAKAQKERRGTDLRLVLEAAGVRSIIIGSPSAEDLFVSRGSLIILRREPGVWAALAGFMGNEIVRRCQAEARGREAERRCAVAEAQATLGRYMLEMRTNVNNALTTMLGNSELLALEAGLPASVQVQANSIRDMALRLHEIFQRFSSLDNELTVAARSAGKKSLSAVAGKS